MDQGRCEWGIPLVSCGHPDRAPLRRARLCRSGRAAFVLFLAACGGSSSRPNVGYGYALQASAGVYNDGSGKLGIGVLSTFRDAAGAGPSTPWNAALSDAAGAIPVQASYSESGPASYASWWWPQIAPRIGGYTLSLSQGAQSLSVGFTLSAAAPLAVPVATLSADGSLLSWPAVASAASYACRVYSGSLLQLSTLQSATACDLTALPPGSYTASVLAFSADLTALRAVGAQEPALPPRFDVSEARLAFVRPQPGAAVLKAQAAGGAIHYGTSTPGLAIWLALTQADGAPTATAWSVRVVGPGLPASSPLAYSYPANVVRNLVWSYDVSAAPGLYSLTATSGATSVAASFSVGQPPSLPIPATVSATAQVGGGATVAWGPVTGAKSYFAAVWTQATPQNPRSSFVAGNWFGGSPATFPSGSFVAGTPYDVYVAASDADMVAGGPAPSQVAVSENTFNPASFTAR